MSSLSSLTSAARTIYQTATQREVLNEGLQTFALSICIIATPYILYLFSRSTSTESRSDQLKRLNTLAENPTTITNAINTLKILALAFFVSLFVATLSMANMANSLKKVTKL